MTTGARPLGQRQHLVQMDEDRPRQMGLGVGAAARTRIGQVVIGILPDGFSLRHESDEAREDLEVFHSPEDAAAIARWDDAGDYRPLKTSPNLRRGWELRLGSTAELRLALDLLYPAALGNWRAVLRGEKIAQPLRETLNRQTGMYRITGLLTRDEATRLIASLCRPGCLRQILHVLGWLDPKSIQIVARKAHHL